MRLDDSTAQLPAPDHLFTWLDVEQHLARLAQADRWPQWLSEASAYWDALRLTVSVGTSPPEVWSWLRDAFGPLTIDAEREIIFLDQSDRERALPVEVEFTVENSADDRIPQWRDHRITADLKKAIPLPPGALPGDTPVCVFHSFKGGVGRTLHCLALAKMLGDAGRRVLLVDGDLEAPGITWMADAQKIRMDFAFEDFLALVHGSVDTDFTDALDLGAKFLANQEIDNVVIMPARRKQARIAPPRIEPVDLLSADRDPYVLSDTLARLAQRVNADVVLVDLRAGISELSAPLLLDPRLDRVFTSTISDQSVRGTLQVLGELAQRAPGRVTDPGTTVILTQFNPADHVRRLESVAADIRRAALHVSMPAVDTETADVDADADTDEFLLVSPFDPRLLNLPAAWSNVNDTIATVGLSVPLAPLAERLTQRSSPVPSPSDESSAHDSTPAATRGPDDLRRQLADKAESLKFADTSTDKEFLVTEALDSLVETHRTEPPIEIVIGAKGSGKTFTFLQLCERESWQTFARAAGVPGVRLDSPAVPVFWSVNLPDARRDSLVETRRNLARTMTGGEAPDPLDLKNIIDDMRRPDATELQWRRAWLACLARAVGLDATPDDAEQKLTELARSSNVIFVVDGLEDLFPNFTTDDAEKRALRALLNGCTEWLRSLRGRPLGLVVFIRRDLAQRSIEQNFGQFESRYRNYALRWNRTEVLRLAAWVCQRGGVLQEDITTVKEATTDRLSNMMLSVWGERMGSEKSREARSEPWFYAALSDFTGQIQARDVVSFIGQAAALSVGDRRWQERILVPAGMRSALPVCSAQKIDDIGQENPPVKLLLEKLRNLRADERRVPFTLDVVKLSLEEARLLETNGVLFREDDQYWIPEIFRHGLGFRTAGRPRVLAVANLVRRRNDLT